MRGGPWGSSVLRGDQRQVRVVGSQWRLKVLPSLAARNGGPTKSRKTGNTASNELGIVSIRSLRRYPAHADCRSASRAKPSVLTLEPSDSEGPRRANVRATACAETA